ncbi:MAG: hypothetical protein HN855_01510 [Anaerolineae bacterium]|nr:hypothetical protein [Anaerolineae bacterium]MBT7323817.1 hypothetical protein [Anaerolineae bacterium]
MSTNAQFVHNTLTNLLGLILMLTMSLAIRSGRWTGRRLGMEIGFA